jgi:hypothetical protein
MKTIQTSTSDVILYVIASIMPIAFLSYCIQILFKSYDLFIFTYNVYIVDSKLINTKYLIGLSVVGLITILICVLFITILLNRSKFPTYVSAANDLKALSKLFKK